jgi:NAD(P)-dependent dehydrogenase (short-subunit alcohol dehydrogenase family)
MALPLEGRIALVSGASRGIGAATAIALAKLGAHLILTARTEGGLEETDDAIRAAGLPGATLLPLDLHDGDQLDTIGPSLLQRFGRLDILVSNAGTLGRLTPAAHILPRDWSDVVAVNLSAAWRLIRTCGPLLQIAPAGRAVFVTSRRAGEPRAYWGAYGATQAGMQHLVLTWAAESHDTRLRINLFDPGVVATRLRRAAMPGEDQSTLPKPDDIAPAIAALCLESEARHGKIIQWEQE